MTPTALNRSVLAVHMLGAGILGCFALIPPVRADQQPRIPVAGYKFDEGTGTTAADSFGSIPGSLQGPSGFSSEVPISYPGNFSLDLSSTGTNDFVDLGDQSSLFFTNSFSISLWARPTANVQNPFGQYLVADYSASADLSSFAIRLQGTNQGANAGQAAFFWENPQQNVTFATSTTDLDSTLNVWYHLLAVWEDTDGDAGDEGVRSIYINGVLEGTESTAQVRSDVGGNTAIGRAGSFDALNFNFDGQIDDVAFFDYALNAQEASWLHNHSLRSIPEPASFSLFVLGGLLLGGKRVRRGIVEV
jgi:hypothetical protein